MRTLLLLRHARAVAGSPSGRDADRPLHPDGWDDAARIGRDLRARGPQPAAVVASPAVRVRETLDAFLPAAGIDAPVAFADAIYAAGTAELAELVRSLPDDVACALVVGHNPAMQEVLGQLAGAWSLGMAPAALACLETDAPRWSELGDGGARLRWLISPPV